MENIIKSIEDSGEITVEIDYGNTHPLVQHRIDNYLIEFIVSYTKQYNSCISSDYLHPSECDFDIKFTDIDDVCVYSRNEPLELSDEDVLQIKQIIEPKLIF